MSEQIGTSMNVKVQYAEPELDSTHITVEIERTGQMVKRLDESITQLGERLRPALIDGRSVPSVDQDLPEPMRSPLATRIAATADHLYRLVNRVDELRAAIDI